MSVVTVTWRNGGEWSRIHCQHQDHPFGTLCGQGVPQGRYIRIDRKRGGPVDAFCKTCLRVLAEQEEQCQAKP